MPTHNPDPLQSSPVVHPKDHESLLRTIRFTRELAEALDELAAAIQADETVSNNHRSAAGTLAGAASRVLDGLPD
jgi:hypothetical protein